MSGRDWAEVAGVAFLAWFVLGNIANGADSDTPHGGSCVASLALYLAILAVVLILRPYVIGG